MKKQTDPENNIEKNENIDNEENNEKITTDTSTVDIESDDSPKEKSTFFGKKNPKESKLKEKITHLEAEMQELNERYLRLFSEFDNYKKRTSREKLELLSTASETVITYLLPVIDDFERAIQANQEVENIDAVKEGFEIIYKKMLQVLKHFNVEEIPAKDELFNTDMHEAVTHFPTDNEAEKGKIVEVLNKGYKIRDKVIRFSKVVVAN